MANSKSAKKTSTKNSKKKKRINFRRFFLVGFMLLAMIAFIFSSLPAGLFFPKKSSSASASYSGNSGGNSTSNSSIVFKKEGELTFSSPSGEAIQKIDIEVSQGEAERNMGLMYRRSLPENSGMLFIMDENKEQSFWMKNTYISLDIIYVNEQKEIVSITEGTTPLSEAPIPSKGEALYVIEVIAGYCQSHNIKIGDRVDWSL